MPTYDFRGVSPSDFEALCHDLLERSLQIRLQAFTSGRDRGIDLRYAPAEGKESIVQCKHYADSGYSKLKSHLERVEIGKIRKLNPGRYVLATSVGLTPPNVDELFDLLAPHCKSKEDIIGRDNLNALLRHNPDIERAHFKLWLTSEAVLDRVLHNDVFVQSLLSREHIERKLGMYVHTESFARAQDKLESSRVCILSGLPGVGKTTLAELLLIEYLMRDWQLITIHQNVSEGLRLIESMSDRKQVIYYDDFLGQISTGERLGKNEDRALLQLMSAVSQSPNKRFILTTREYILAQAKAEHELLARSEVDIYRFVVECTQYSEIDKARILANHLYFANVPQEHIAAIVRGQAYRKIISHRNYSPRIIEWMTHSTETSSCDSADYPTVFLERLSNPSQLWQHAYENQIGEASRSLLLVLASCGDGVLISDLGEAFAKFHSKRAEQYRFATSPASFEKALEELEGNFIRIERGNEALIVSAHNASIFDYLGHRLIEHPNEVSDLVANSVFFEQLERLFGVFEIDVRSHSAVSELSGSVLVTAIDRTFSSRGIRLMRIESRPTKWLRIPPSSWARLKRCCIIANQLSKDELHRHVLALVQSRFAQLDWHAGELADVLEVMELLESYGWCDAQLPVEFSNHAWKALVGEEVLFGEPLDGLAALANWFALRRTKLDQQTADRLATRIKKAIIREIKEPDGGNDPEKLSGDLSILEDLGDTLGYDFGAEIQWIEDRLSEYGQMGNEDDDDWRRDGQIETSTSIEALFDSLLD